MNLSISNIAWNPSQNEAVYKLLNEYKFSGVEVAPGKVFESVGEDTKAFVNLAKKYNLKLPAMQSLLYKRPDLELFFSTEATISHLKKMIDLAQILGVRTLVFGSPKNRDIKNLSPKMAFEKAVEIFSELGEYAKSKNTIFCIEPNAAEYGCNFITTTHEALELVKAVNSKGFGLHFDSAVAFLGGENLEQVLESALPKICHFHISSPFLESILTTKELHLKIAQIMKTSNYNNYLSIEMKEQNQNNLEHIKNCLDFVANIYQN